MALSRYLVGPNSSSPLSTPSLASVTTLFCACGVLLNATAFDASAQPSTPPAASRATSPTDAIGTLPPPPSGILAPAKIRAPQPASPKNKNRKDPKEITPIGMPGSSRVVRRHAGSLDKIAPEKIASTRLALTSPDLRPTVLDESETSAQTSAGTAPHIIVAQPQASARRPSTPASDEAAPVIIAQAETTARPAQNVEDIHVAEQLGPLPLATNQSAAVPAEPASAPGATVERESTQGAVPVTGTIGAPLPRTSTPATTQDAQANGDEKKSDAKSGDAKDGKKASDGESRLFAPRITYDRGTIIAEGDEGDPVRLESSQARIIANRVVLDTTARTVKAAGQVRVEREINANRFQTFRPPSIATSETQKERITESLTGDDFEYNFGTQEGKLDNTRVRMEHFNIEAEQLVINGRRYIARNVRIWPGGLSDEEIRIYGRPPFNIRAKEAIIDNSKPAPPAEGVEDTVKNDTQQPTGPRTEIKSASLYFKNLRLLPIPSALLRRQGGAREQATYQLTPRVYFNSADGLLLTTKLEYPLSPKTPGRLDLEADVGISTRVGFRGGLGLSSGSGLGRIAINARVNDVISSQLTDRIELDRLPEIQYRPPALKLFRLPGARLAGLQFGFIAGDYKESFTNQRRSVEDSKLQAQVRFTTRMGTKEGPYLDLFARAARYGDFADNLRTAGFEVGYIGRITPWINGQFSFSAQDVDGQTPFRFDKVEIKRELRTTFDVMITPRYIIPIDLRYDLDERRLRDQTFGLLRNYKTFAYGVVYQTSRSELRLELRHGF